MGRVSGLEQRLRSISLYLYDNTSTSSLIFKLSIGIAVEIDVTWDKLRPRQRSQTYHQIIITFQKMHHHLPNNAHSHIYSNKNLSLHPSLQPPPLSPHLPLIQQFLTQPNNPPRPKSNHTRGTKPNCHGRIHRS